MGTEGVGHPALTVIAGDAVDGLLLTLPADFAAVQAVLATITAVGDDPVKVAAYLHQHSVESVIGRLSWNRQGDLNAFNFQMFTWHKPGSRSLAVR